MPLFFILGGIMFKKICNLLLIMLFSILTFTVTKADIKLAYNGNAVSEPFGYTGATKTTIKGKGVKYFDWFCPYKLTIADIGGYAISSNGPSIISKDTAKKRLLCQSLNQYGSGSRTLSGITSHRDKDGMQVIEYNGCKFYLCAIGDGVWRWCEKSGYVDKDYCSNFSCSKGVLFDVMLTDGKVLHFIAFDEFGHWHSNNDTTVNGTNSLHKNDKTHPYNYTHADGRMYTQFAKLNYPQYDRAYYAGSCTQLLELQSADINKFSKKYFKNGVGVYAMRFYNKTFHDLVSNDKIKVNRKGVSHRVKNLTGLPGQLKIDKTHKKQLKK